VAKIRKILIAFTPPIIISAIRWIKTSVKIQEGWSGNFSSWAEAQIRCTGYNSDVILEKSKNALLKVKNGEAKYERDSVLFDEIQYSWSTLAGLQKAALENNGKLCVLDFGGSLGSTYYQNKNFLNSLQELRWCIVEQSHFVSCGKEFFEDDQLKFYRTIEECIAEQKPNVILLSGVLQYLENPYEWIKKFIGLGITYIIIDRTSFVESEDDILTVQNVPENIYPASYPCWLFNENKFIRTILKHYTLFLSFNALDISNLTESYFKGFILKKKGC
jgi:putative methyltransferase (TIGR04325 family)